MRRGKRKSLGFFAHSSKGKEEEEEEELNKWLFPLFSWEKKKFSPLIKLLLRRRRKEAAKWLLSNFGRGLLSKQERQGNEWERKDSTGRSN